MMFTRSLSSFLLVLSGVVALSQAATFSRDVVGVSAHGSVFGVPRGGGLFGGKDTKP